MSEDKVGLTSLNSPREYFEHTRDKWVASGLVDDVDEETGLRLAMALDLIAAYYLEEVHRDGLKFDNHSCVIITLKLILEELPDILPNISYDDTLKSSDEIKEIYEKVKEKLSSYRELNTKRKRNKLSKKVAKEILHNRELNTKK